MMAAPEQEAKTDERTEDEAGLICLDCACRHFFTIDVRPCRRGIRRRRECRNCGKRVTTTERVVGE